MNRWRRAPAALWLGLWLAVVVAWLPGQAQAHEMSMAEMHLRETAPGEFVWQWGVGEKRAPAEVLRPVWPEPCQAQGPLLRCGAAGLSGRLAVDGIGNGFSAALVKVAWRDGQTRVYTLTSAQPAVQLYGSADDRRSLGEVASAYTVLGVEHILSGVDHLLFVIGLLFLVGFQRRLLWTITAFTAAHSLTLASSALGWLVLRPPPVEATIALSIVLVAGEALHTRQTLARRWPALVAFLFGLVHGLGFAGALKEIGLPEQHLPAALLSFNVGVELGQLATVALAWALLGLARRMAPQGTALARARAVTLYGIGSVAAYWSWLRVAALLG
ncbi:HupE/UreJ family protein [Ideonella sp. DXS22W]|uniref:HupE/UreJ family protein n=1 Tax=Pseudaquabacterium inlustre TaxID=2984192 RepID=A0ABU9CDS4_9BURK